MSGSYVNPFSGTPTPSRVDEGVDYGGTADVHAIGNAVVDFAGSASAKGWPGTSYIAYTLTDGPRKGKTIFVAEGLTSSVRTGQRLTAGQLVGRLIPGSSTGIEMGWADPGHSLQPAAQTSGGYKEGFRTAAGVDFNAFAHALGAPLGTGSGPIMGHYSSGGGQGIVADATGAVAGAVSGAVSGVAAVVDNPAQAALNLVWGGIGPDVTRGLLYLVILAGGAYLAYLGITRLTGVDPATPLKAAMPRV